ncbi:hypothetical protein [Winogradskyella bathintestinalis]|uniref:Uncharacterized protein n=1 Tax=Winogradskyella bathintestinalis TaxID=3035208 RepID=A0ABT7ZXU4_9FLAO|nr:hypothetical protein [Winogradskyella bathintestinalis]MDN3493832.1 hypothetical protein [Winogradskyella bathintestinalis]
MIKQYSILLFTIFAIFSYGQDVTFEKNHNRAASGLEQNINKKGDSLIFKSDKVIRQVDIFNNDYMKSIPVNNYESKIEVGNLPVGEYIVQARLGRKRIIMYLVKNGPIVPDPEILDININDDSAVAQTDNSVETSNDSSALVSENITSEELDSEKISYWVVYEKNTSSGSYKSMSLENINEVSRMISKNKLELNTEIAKNNTLIVYEVYNSSKFMRKQLRKPTYFKSSDNSKIFNGKPYYASANVNFDTDELP